jgi:hypothetical protein
MRLREPYVRKHVCSFEMSNTDWVNPHDYMVERRCTNCDKVQYAVVPVPLPLPEELLVYGDYDWVDGTICDHVGELALKTNRVPVPRPSAFRVARTP